MILSDRQTRLKYTANTMGISRERVLQIVHIDLDMKKVCEMVSKMLERDETSRPIHARFKENLEYLNLVVALNET